MLKFPVCFSTDGKANTIIKKYMNQRVIDIMEDSMLMYKEGGYDAIEETDQGFREEIFWHFPDNYPQEKMVGKYLGLYALLTSEEEFIPDLCMEYMMDSLLRTLADMEADSERKWDNPMPEREYVLAVMRKEFGDITEEEEDIRSGEDILRGYESLSEYRNYYFWDMDFTLLDMLTEEEIQNSEANRQLGIIDADKKENTFILQKDWNK